MSDLQKRTVRKLCTRADVAPDNPRRNFTGFAPRTSLAQATHMRTTLRWLLVVLVILLAASCFSGRRRTGTNVGTDTGSGYDGPWSQGGTTAAATGAP